LLGVGRCECATLCRRANKRGALIRGVAEARGNGETMMGNDGLLITLPKGSDKIQTKSLL